MSEMSIKRQKTEDNYKKDSFSDRFGDDLCEEILQFLPFEAKPGLECVSKQFQRTVFVKQTELIIFSSFNENDFAEFEKVLKKLPNIKIVDWVPIYTEDEPIEDRVLDLVIKNCPQITHIGSGFDDFKMYEKFIAKIGPKLVSIAFNCGDELKLFHMNWQTLTNIEELVLNDFTPQLTHITFSRLKKFEIIGHIEDEDTDQLEALLQLNANSIKHLCLQTLSEDVNQIKSILKMAANIQNLVEFRLSSRFPLNGKPFVEGLRQLSLKCGHLKSLYIDYSLDLTNGEPIEEILSPLRRFKELKRLTLLLKGSEESLKLFSFKAFKGLNKLTHLEISYDSEIDEIDISEPKFSETVLTDIDINLPNLQSLKIDFYFVELSEWTADILSRLSRLQTIKIRVTNDSVIPHIREQLLKNCKKIKLESEDNHYNNVFHCII